MLNFLNFYFKCLLSLCFVFKFDNIKNDSFANFSVNSIIIFQNVDLKGILVELGK